MMGYGNTGSSLRDVVAETICDYTRECRPHREDEPNEQDYKMADAVIEAIRADDARRALTDVDRIVALSALWAMSGAKTFRPSDKQLVSAALALTETEGS